MDSAYSNVKPAWHSDRIDVLKDGRAPMPVHLQLVISDLCNHDCSFCAYRMSTGLSRELFGTAETHNPNRRMATAKALEILESGAANGLKAVQFTGGGEPTVHADHIKIFSAAHQLGLEGALVTNGVKLTTDEAFLRMRWVRVSVDAGDGETYAKVRGVSIQHWSTVWANLHAFARQYQGRLGVGFVVTPENYREMADCAQRCADAGVENMRIGAVFSTEGDAYYGDLIPAIKQEIERAKEVSGIKVISMFDRRVSDLDAGPPSHDFCGYQYLTTYVGADLGVYRCCNTAYSTRGKVGDLTGQTFGDYLRGLKFDGFDARGCTYCQYNGQNAVIRNAMRSGVKPMGVQPEHVNFV